MKTSDLIAESNQFKNCPPKFAIGDIVETTERNGDIPVGTIAVVVGVDSFLLSEVTHSYSLKQKYRIGRNLFCESWLKPWKNQQRIIHGSKQAYPN